MRRVYLAAACAAVAVGASCAVVAGAAATLPEYRFCVKADPAKTGEFTEGGCETHSTTPHRGGWEIGSWAQAKNTTLKGTFGASKLKLYEPKDKDEPWTGGADLGAVHCKKGNDVGRVTGAKTSTEAIALNGCEFLGRKCTTSGAKTGTIVTVPLDGELGYVSGGVGALLKPVEGGRLAEFGCTSDVFTVSLSGAMVAVDSGNVSALAKQGTRTLAIVPETWAQEVVFGEFPSGEGPFYMTALGENLLSDETHVVGASLEGVETIRFVASVEIER